MNAVLRRRLERAVRVRDFLRARRTEGAEAVALTRHAGEGHAREGDGAQGPAGEAGPVGDRARRHRLAGRVVLTP